MSQVSKDVISQLAPTGVLRAGINLSNFLLVTGKSPTGDPVGVSPDMARGDRASASACRSSTRPSSAGRARRRGGYGRLGHRADRRRAAAGREDRVHRRLLRDRGDLYGARRLAVEDHRGCRQAGRPDRRDGPRRLRPLAGPQHQGRHAGATDSLDSAYEKFVADKLDALAGLRPRLITDVKKLPGAAHPRRPVHGRAAGDRHARARTTAGAAFLRDVRRGGEGLGPGRAADRAPQGRRPVGGAAGLRAGSARQVGRLAWRTCQHTPAGSMMWILRPQGKSVGGRVRTPGNRAAGSWHRSPTSRPRGRRPRR